MMMNFRIGFKVHQTMNCQMVTNKDGSNGSKTAMVVTEKKHQK